MADEVEGPVREQVHAAEKAIAARVLDLQIGDPAEMLSGRLLANEGIVGAVEADFFDWPLLAEGGYQLVRALAAETIRFRLRDVEVDVLKSLYESLIDPDERHDLGPDLHGGKRPDRVEDGP